MSRIMRTVRGIFSNDRSRMQGNQAMKCEGFPFGPYGLFRRIFLISPPMHSYYVSANFLLILSRRIKFVEKYLDDHEIFASCRPMFPAVGLRFNYRWALCSAFYMAKRLIDTLLGVTNFRRAPGGRSHTG